MSLLEMRGINKSFSGVQVLKDVSLTVEKGEVHALLGENGAGKSTLMNILTGVYTRDSGTVIFDGQELKDTTVRDSEKAGIAFVHQELNLFNDLTVYENIFLGKEYTNKLGKTDKKRMIKEAEAVGEPKTSDKKLMSNSKRVTGYRVQVFAGGNTREDRAKANKAIVSVYEIDDAVLDDPTLKIREFHGVDEA